MSPELDGKFHPPQHRAWTSRLPLLGTRPGPRGEGELCLGFEGGVRVCQGEDLGRAFETEGIACTKKEQRVTGAVTNSFCHILSEEVLREGAGPGSEVAVAGGSDENH